MKKPIAIVLTLLIMASCQQPQSSSVNNVIEVEYWTFSDIYKDYAEDNAERYNKTADTPISLNVTVYSPDELDYKLWSSLQSGIGTPDLVDLEQARFGRYINPRNNYIVPLNSIIDPKKATLTELSYSKYQGKGFYYGIDYYENNMVVIYNNKIMEAAGIAVDEIVTFDDYMEAGRQVLSKLNVPLLAVDYTDDFAFEALTTYAGGGYCDISGEPTVNHEQNILTLELLHQMIYQDTTAVTAPGGEYFSYEFFNYFNEGKVASVIVPFWYAGYVERYMPNLKEDIALGKIPTLNNQAYSGVQIGGVVTAIPIHSKNPLAIKAFLRETRMREDSAVAAYDKILADPIAPATYTKEWVKRDDKKFTNCNGRQRLSEIRKSPATANISANYYLIADKIRSELLFKVLREGSVAPAEALEKLQQNMSIKD